MTLKFSVTDITTVEEAMRPLYVESNGSYTLDVEGAVPKSKLDEFRMNNIELSKKLDSLKGVDAEKYTKLLELQARVDEKKLIDSGKIDEVVESRISSLRSDYEQKSQQAQQQIATLMSSLQQRALSAEIGSVAIKSGVQETAIDDVMLRASGVFSMDEHGALVAKDAKGNVLYGKNGIDPLTTEEWVKSLVKFAPHLFKASSGGSAPGGSYSSATRGNMSAVQKIQSGL